MSSSTQSLDCQKPTRALLSIKPQFAEAILRGKKKFEFRRVLFKRDVDVVVVYSTAPVKKVVAEFDVSKVISDEPSRLWSKTKNKAGIPQSYFTQYFQGRDVGHAIQIGEVREYRQPCDLKEVIDVKPPQSFVYMDARKTLSCPLPK